MVNIQRALLRQVRSGFLVCLSCLIIPMSFSWVSLAELVLRSQESPVGPLSDSQISWLGSLPGLGAIFGTLLWSRIINKVGRKNTAVLATVPMFTAHLMYLLARRYYILLISRFLSGIGMIGIMQNTPGYIAEICEPNIKSSVASLFAVLINLGSVLMFLNGFLLTYFYLNVFITIIPVIIATLIFLLVPESPVYLIKVGQDEKAKEQLKWLRASHDANYIDTDFKKLKENFLNANECTKRLTYSEIWHNSYYLKSLLMGLVLQSSIYMSGLGVLTTYLYSVLTNVLNLNETADRDQLGKYGIILSSAIFSGSLIGTSIFHKFNRKVFLVGCNLTAAISLLFISISIYLRVEFGVYINTAFYILAFLVYALVQGLGLGSVVYIILPELLAAECRDSFTATALFLHFSIHFILCKLYPVLVGTIHLHWWLLIFGSYSLWISIFGYFILPETKDKSIQQISNKLSRNRRNDRGNPKTHTSKISTIF